MSSDQRDGSPVARAIVAGCDAAERARLAEPGSSPFARVMRRIDLVQAEAVQDLVEAATPSGAGCFDQLEGRSRAGSARSTRRCSRADCGSLKRRWTSRRRDTISSSRAPRRRRSTRSRTDRNAARRRQARPPGARAPQVATIIGRPNPGKSEPVRIVLLARDSQPSASPATFRGQQGRSPDRGGGGHLYGAAITVV